MDLLVISRYRFPVDNIVESLHIIGAQIFIFQVVSVFPDIDAQDRHETAAFDDRVVLGSGWQTAAFAAGSRRQPGPA